MLNKPSKTLPEFIYLEPKWRNFTKSGHTGRQCQIRQYQIPNDDDFVYSSHFRSVDRRRRRYRVVRRSSINLDFPLSNY